MSGLRPDRFGQEDFNFQAISICGKSLIAHKSGALYWPAEKALLVADLHLEKASHFAGLGQMLPPYDTRETLTKLAHVIDVFGAETVICMGDSLHDNGGADRIAERDLESLKVLQDDREWIWLTGNHDSSVRDTLGGHVRDEIRVEGLVLRHEPRLGQVSHEIAAHLHPAARIVMHGTSLRRPCFISNGLRIVLPAFGAFTGGLNVLDEAFEPLFSNDGFSIWMMGQDGLYPIATRLLRED